MGLRSAFVLGTSLFAASQAIAEDTIQTPGHIEPDSAYGILSQQYYGEPLDYIYKHPDKSRITATRVLMDTVSENIILSALANGNPGAVETIAAKPYEQALNEETTFYGYIFSTYSPLDNNIGLHVLGCDFISDERNAATTADLIDASSINTHISGQDAVEYCTDKVQPDLSFNIVHSFFEFRTPTMAALIHGLKNSGTTSEEPKRFDPDPIDSPSLARVEYALPPYEAG